MSNLNCIYPTKADIKRIKKYVDVGDLTDDEILSAIHRVADAFPGLSADELLENKLAEINSAIAEVKNGKMEKAAEKAKPKSIGNAKVELSTKTTYEKKTDIASDSRTLYVFSESAQARETLTGQKTGMDGVDKVADKKERDRLLSQSETSTNARTDINGNPMPNAAGIIITKNKVGKNTQAENTEQYKKDILAAVNRDIDSILEKLSGNNYDKVIFPDEMSGNLSKDLADEIAKVFLDRLGLYSQVLHLFPGSTTYKIKFSPIVAPEKSSTKNKNMDALKKEMEELVKNANSEVTSRTEEARQSLRAERPTKLTATLEDNELNTLSRVFPEISVRKSRIDYLTNKFSTELTNRIKDEIDYLTNDLPKELLDSPHINTEFTNREMLEGLTRGKEEEIRIFALKNLIGEDGLPLPLSLIQGIKEMLDIVANADVEDIATDILLNEEDSLGEIFLKEAEDKGWGTIDEDGNPSKKLLNYANKRALHIKQEFGKMAQDEIFAALMEETRYDLELNEGIVINEIGLSAKTQESLDKQELDEYNLSLGKMDFIMKYKLLNPVETLSVKVRSLLNTLYRVKVDKHGNKHIQYDDLGLPVKINPMFAYYIILDKVSNFNTLKEFDERLDDLVNTYPWMSEIVYRVKPTKGYKALFEPELRKEFYRACNKTYTQFGFISVNGKFVSCNRKNSNEVLLEIISKSYEGGLTVGDYSIYDETGTPIDKNIGIIRKLVSRTIKSKREEDIKKENPIYWASVILHNSHQYKIEDIAEAIKIIRGESDNNKVSLEELIKDVGIDTSELDMNQLYPTIDLENVEYTRDPKTGDVLAVDGEDTIPILTKQQMEKIVSIINSIAAIVHPTTGFRQGIPLVHTFQGYYLKIGTALSMLSDGFTQATFRMGDKSRFSYTVPSFIDRMTHAISSKDEVAALQYIEDNYGKFTFFKNQDTQRYYNGWLSMMTDMNNPNIARVLRENFMSIQMLAFGGKDIQNVSKEGLIEGAINAYFSQNSASGINFGLFRNPLFSDVDAMVFFKFRRFTAHNEYDDEGVLQSNFDFKDRIIRYLVDTLKQDLFRARDVRRGVKSKEEEIDFYNSGKKPRGSILNFFPELDTDALLEMIKKYDDESSIEYERSVSEALYEIVKDLLDKYATDFISKIRPDFKVALYNRRKKEAGGEIAEEAFNDEASVEDVENDNLSVKDEDSPEISEELKERMHKIEEADKLLEEFYYNDFFAQSQIIQLIGGDLAYYKNFVDFIKRNKQSFAGGERLYPEDDEGNHIVDTGIYLEDLVKASNTFDSLRKLVLSDKTTGDIEKGMILGAFTEITTTDGQTLRTLPSFRKLLKAMGGKWTDSMEAAYNRITVEKKITAEDFYTLWQPIKPFLFSHETRVINGRIEKIVTQHKNSEYLLSAMYSMLNTALNQSPVLVGLNKFMDKYNIDSAHFRSVVKEGGNNFINLNYNPKTFKSLAIDGKIEVGNKLIEAPDYDSFMNNMTEALRNGEITSDDYNKTFEKLEFKSAEEVIKFLEKATKADKNKGTVDKTYIHTFPIEDYMIMQPTDDHIIDTKAIFGSQLRNIVPADLPETFTIKVGDVTLEKEEAIKYYNGIFAEKLIRAFQNIAKEFKSMEDIEAMLQAKMKQQPAKYGPDMRKALTLDETKTRFQIPFNSPLLRNKIEDLIISEFGKKLQKQKIKGGNVVLVSNFGLDSLKDFHVHYKKDENGNEVVDYIPAFLSYTMKDQLKDFLDTKMDGGVEVQYLNFERMRKELGDEADEVLKAIGYRIPTEDKYSMFPIKIIGFLPSIGGGTVMLPADIIEMSGTDFDIDKLFFMFKALRREVYRKDLRTAYKDWLEERSIENDTTLMDMMNNLSEEEYFKAIDKAKINDDALINKLFKESFRGLTEEEVESYKRSSDLFREFMETEGFNYKYNKNGKPKYVTYKSKNHKDASGNLDLSETLKRASNEELDNALIDFIYNTLTSYEGSLLMMRQGTYRDAKKSSRIERILHNRGALESFIEKYGADNIQEKLNKLSTKELDNIYEEDATPRSPMDIMYWADNHRNLMDGNDLIGMLAVSSSSHYKLQFLNLKLKEDYIIRLNGKELYELDRVYSPITKKRIGELCAQLQAASPDNGKDPCLGDMNINPKTVDLACLLVRLGVDLTDVGMILNSQEVLNFTYESDESQEKPKIDKNWNLDTAKLAEIKAYITLGKYDLVDPSFIVNFKEWFKNLEKVAKDMTAMNPVLRSDSPNGALKSDFAEAIRQILILKDLKENVLKDGNFSIKGFNELIDFDINATDMSRDELFDKFIKNKIPRLQAIFSLGFTSAVPVIQERLSDFSEASIERLALFMEQTGMDLKKSRNTTIIKQILNEYNAFLLTKDKIFSGEEESSLLEKRNYYIHDFPIKFNAILTVKDNEGFYKYNNIKNLPAIKRISNKTDKGIKMDNIGKISPETRKWYTESFDQLLNMGNDVSAEEKKVAQDLAVDLLLYAFFDNGLTFRYNSFSNFFSSLYMTSIPGLVDAYRMAENLTRSTNNYDERFIAQFLINHPKYVAKVSSKTIKREGNLIYPIKSEGFYPDGVYTPDKRRYREFIALGRGNDITIFRRVIDLSGDDKLAYEKVEINNTGTLYYDGNTNSSDIDYTKVKARGNVKVKLDRLLKEKIIKKKTTVSTPKASKWKWGVTSNNGFEVSTAANKPDVLGDSRFSALNAKFKSGTIIDGVNVGGKTIEYVYQTVIKKSGKGQKPSKDSRLYNPELKTKEERENFSYSKAYLPLWQEWAEQNPELIEELREKARGRELTDRFASKTTVSQARALADILNSTEQKDNSDEPLVRDNFNDNDEFLPNDSGSNDSPIDLNNFKSDDDDIKDKVVGAASSDDNIVIPSNVSFSDDNISIAGITAAANSTTDWLFVAKGKNISSEEANRFIEGAANSMTEEDAKRARAIENASKDTSTPQNLEEIETSDEIKKQCPPQ